jgi:acyl-CoA reductase-like NAD-dependent aldehyde dehydrogenase
MAQKTIQDPNLKVLPSSLTPIIDGKHITRTTGGEIDHIYAATGQVTTKVPLAGAAEIDAAVKSAQAAFPGWRNFNPVQRADLLRKWAKLMENNLEELAQIGTLENGTAINTSRGNVRGGIGAIQYTAGWADKIVGELITQMPMQSYFYTLMEPYGVVLNILPFNSPLAQFCSITSCALVSGKIGRASCRERV